MLVDEVVVAPELETHLLWERHLPHSVQTFASQLFFAFMTRFGVTGKHLFRKLFLYILLEDKGGS